MSLASIEERRARAFVSYQRSEQAFVKELAGLLEKEDVVPWVDWADIRPTEDWLKRILSAIELSDIFIFIITPESCRSRICRLEINHAEEKRKKIIPLLRASVEPQDLPEPIAQLQWIQFTAEEESKRALAELTTAIKTDLEWVSAHTLYLERALEWERRGHRSADTLRGAGLTEAEKWLAKADDKIRVPAPVHRAFIQVSRKTQRRSRIMLLTTLLVACCVLFWLAAQKRLSDEEAALSRKQRDESRTEAEQSKSAAEKKEQEAIASEIAVDRISNPSPLNLSRRRYLEDLLRRAKNVKYSEAETTLQRLLRQIPPDTSRKALIKPDLNRQGVALPTSESHIFVWYPDHIEAYGASGELLNLHRPNRHGQIIWAKSDPTSSGLLYEIEYPDFADALRVQQVRTSGSKKFLPIQPQQKEQEPDLQMKESEIFGSEREMFLFPGVRRGTLPLGLSRKLEPIPLPGDAQASFFSGYLYREDFGPGTLDRKQVTGQVYWNSQAILDRIKSTEPHANKIEVESLAYDFRGRAALLEIRVDGVERTYAGKAEFKTIWTAVVTLNGEISQITDKVNYSEKARFFQLAVPKLKEVVELTDVRPRYTPAALIATNGTYSAILADRIVVSGNGTIQRSTKMNWVPDEILQAQFSPDGRNVIVTHNDRGISIFDSRTGQLVRRFIGPDPKIRSVSHSADGRFVFLFEEDGAVTRWDLAVFGPDGWAAAAAQ